jgi:hypothetical protein
VLQLQHSLTVNEHAEETNNCTKAQELHAVEMKVHSCRQQKEPSLDITNRTQRAFYGPKRRNLNPNGKKVLEFVLQQHKNGLPIT